MLCRLMLPWFLKYLKDMPPKKLVEDFRSTFVAKNTNEVSYGQILVLTFKICIFSNFV